MSRKRDYYEILGLDKTATTQEIKQAYRRLAKKYHPDVSTEKDAQAKFKEVNEAYQILSNPKARQQYDQFGHAAFSGAQGADFSSFFKDLNFEDIFSGFSSFFNQDEQRHSQHQQDNLYLLHLTFAEAMHGVQKRVSLPIEKPCPACQASGAASLNDLRRCQTCHGRGYETKRANSFFGLFEQKVVCSRCHGRKETISKKCSTCRGKQFLKTTEELEINVPKGVESQQQIRFAQKGRFDPLRRLNQDLYVELRVQPSPLYRREELDLFIKVPVSYLDSLLGKKIIIPTIDGEKSIQLDKGIGSGKIYRLRKYGAYNPLNQRERGDLYVEILVTFPSRLPNWLRTALENVDEQNDFLPNKDFIAELKRKKLL